MSAAMSDTKARLVASIALLPSNDLHRMVLNGHQRLYSSESIAERVEEHRLAFLKNADWLAEEGQDILAPEEMWLAMANGCDAEFVANLRAHLNVRAISAAERATAKDLEDCA